jgi:hypothetical protein
LEKPLLACRVHQGLFTVYSDIRAGESYLAIRPDQLNRNFMMQATLESGIGESGLVSGLAD